jgi:hypothetical protein
VPAALPLDEALAEVLDGHLRPFIPLRGVSPENSLHVVSAVGRNLALGNRRGTEQRFGHPVAALRGMHLDGTARIELWDGTPDGVDGAMGVLHANLLGATASLRALGFLKFRIASSGASEHSSVLSAWRKVSDLEFLYEYHATDNDEAESFIVRIPLRSDLEEPGSPEGSIETVIDEMRRWDDEAAPSLVARPAGGGRGVRLTGLLSFAFLPGGLLGAGVTLERGVAGAMAVPTDYPDLDSFLDALGDGPNPDIAARVSFATLADFLDQIGPPGDSFELGDWDEDAVGDVYLPRSRLFARPITLRTGRDFLAVRYGDPALASPAVLYLRILAARQPSG